MKKLIQILQYNIKLLINSSSITTTKLCLKNYNQSYLRNIFTTKTKTSLISLRLNSTSASTSNTNQTIIGIDLGTTNSAVAHLEGTEPKIIENSEGERTTPSIVAFTIDGGRIVGTSAKRQAIVNPENTLFATKRLIGRRFGDPEVQRDVKELPYKIVEHDNGDVWIEARNNKYSPAQIGGFILEKLKDDAENYLNNKKITNAVVTVPAYFNDAQRHATKNAGKVVGLNILRVINEPTAAALAYGLNQKENSLIAVFDLGGGTFDISILDIENGVFEVRSTNGDTHLGGEDFDNKLLKLMISNFEKDYKINLSIDRTAIQRLREASERAKIDLSSNEFTKIDLPFITKDKHFNMKITRKEYEELTKDLIERTISPVKRALRDADIEANDIEEVILVGGMSRMPKVQQTVEELFFKERPNYNPNKVTFLKPTVNPDEAVALGAAIQGAVLAGEVKDLLLLDVMPLSLGIETLGGIFSPLIPRNTTVPTKTSQSFSTGVDGQTKILINVYQGERQLVDDNKFIGHFILSGIDPLPKGVPQITVTFDIDADGIITVSARDKISNKDASITVAGSSGLSKGEIEKMVKDAIKFKDADKLKKDTIEQAARADSVCNDTEASLKQFSKQIDENKANELLARIEEVRPILKEGLKGKQFNYTETKAKCEEIQKEAALLFETVFKTASEKNKSQE